MTTHHDIAWDIMISIRPNATLLPFNFTAISLGDISTHITNVAGKRDVALHHMVYIATSLLLNRTGSRHQQDIGGILAGSYPGA